MQSKMIRVPALLAAIGLAACGGGGDSAVNGNQATPAAPSNLVITSTAATAVALSWTDNATNELGFRVERSADNVTYSVVGTLPADTTVFSDTGISTNTSYSYRIVAFNASGDSASSSLATTNTHTLASLEGTLSTAINGLQGNEITTSYPVSGAVTGTVNLNGFAFCLPTSPYAAPAATANPPNNVYGCTNNATVVITPSANSVTITISTPTFYVGGAVTLNGLVTNSPVYMTYSNAVLTMNAALTTMPDGRKQIGIISGSSLSYGGSAIYAQNTLLNSSLSLIQSTVSSQYDAYFSSQANVMAALIIANLPPFVQ